MDKSFLYIIGNGFDLHPGLSTRYSDFHRYIVAHYPDLERDFEEHFRMDVDHQYLLDIPLHSTPRFRYKVRHPFRAKVHQYSAGKVTIYSAAKYATLQKELMLAAA
jgi:hypothetical protein